MSQYYGPGKKESGWAAQWCSFPQTGSSWNLWLEAAQVATARQRDSVVNNHSASARRRLFLVNFKHEIAKSSFHIQLFYSYSGWVGHRHWSLNFIRVLAYQADHRTPGWEMVYQVALTWLHLQSPCTQIAPWRALSVIRYFWWRLEGSPYFWTSSLLPKTLDSYLPDFPPSKNIN